MRSPMLLDLSELDPARDLRAPGRADDPALQAILASDRSAPTRVAPPRRPARPAVVAGVGALAVAALAVGTTLVTTLGGPPAYASWSAQPRVLTPEQTAERAEGCPTSASAITGEGGAGAEVERVRLAPVSAEARGDYTYVVLAGDHAYADCFVTATHDGSRDEAVSSSAVVDRPVTGRDAAPGLREVDVLRAGTASWSTGGTGEGAVTSAFGRAGDDVAGLAVTLSSGQRVEAAVSDGWWSLWAPGEVTVDGPAELTFTDGTTAPVELPPAEG